MKPSDQKGFRAFNRCRLISPLLLPLLVVSSAIARIRRIEISTYIHPGPAASAAARAYFPGQGRLGGGVVPRGSADFLSPEKEKLRAGQLKLVILDRAKLRNNRPDYDAIGLQWNGNVYQLSTQDNLIYPLMKFIKRGSYIAYTIPVAGYNKDYFDNNHLVPFRNVGRLGMGYVAEEFKSTPHAGFLEYVDFARAEVITNYNLKARILRDVRRGNGQRAGIGSYVNADFHVTYQVFLDNVGGKKVADVGGLPLRYHWVAPKRGSAVVRDVEVFKFPETEFDEQYRAVLFFQTAAILRQFMKDNRPEFDRFMKEVGDLVGER